MVEAVPLDIVGKRLVHQVAEIAGIAGEVQRVGCWETEDFREAQNWMIAEEM